jgi:hypothetical protein
LPRRFHLGLQTAGQEHVALINRAHHLTEQTRHKRHEPEQAAHEAAA